MTDEGLISKTNSSYTTHKKTPKPTTCKTNSHLKSDNGERIWIDIFPKKKYRWLIGTWKDSQYHQLLDKCKSKWDITSQLSEWLSSKDLQITNVGEDVEKREALYTVGGNIDWYSRHYGKSMLVPQNTKNRTTIWSSNFTPGYLNGKYQFEKIHVSQCSQKHYSQWPKHGSNPNAY